MKSLEKVVIVTAGIPLILGGCLAVAVILAGATGIVVCRRALRLVGGGKPWGDGSIEPFRSLGGGLKEEVAPINQRF